MLFYPMEFIVHSGRFFDDVSQWIFVVVVGAVGKFSGIEPKMRKRE